MPPDGLSSDFLIYLTHKFKSFFLAHPEILSVF